MLQLDGVTLHLASDIREGTSRCQRGASSGKTLQPGVCVSCWRACMLCVKHAGL